MKLAMLWSLASAYHVETDLLRCSASKMPTRSVADDAFPRRTVGTRVLSCIAGLLLAAIHAASGLAAEPAAGLPNPFYAMDTAVQRPGLTLEQQLDLLKELGYAGVAWTEPPPTLSEQEALEKVKAT